MNMHFLVLPKTCVTVITTAPNAIPFKRQVNAVLMFLCLYIQPLMPYFKFIAVSSVSFDYLINRVSLVIRQFADKPTNPLTD